MQRMPDISLQFFHRTHFEEFPNSHFSIMQICNNGKMLLILITLRKCQYLLFTDPHNLVCISTVYKWILLFNIQFDSKYAKWRAPTVVCITDLDKLNLVKICNGGLGLGSKQFPLLPQLPQKLTLASNFVKSESKTIISLCWCKYMTHSVIPFKC